MDDLDRIHVRDLMVRCIIGINPEERVNRQDVTINLTLWADLRNSGKTDYHLVASETFCEAQIDNGEVYRHRTVLRFEVR